MPTPRAPRAGAVAALLALATGCSTLAPPRFVSERVAPPDRVAREVAAASTHPPPPVAEPAAPPRPAHAPRSLSDLVDRALATDPGTRAVWQDARAAAAVAGSRRASFLPSLDAGLGLQRQRTPGTPARPPSTPARPASEQTTWGPSASLSWILLDLGGRAALVDEADQLLVAARLAEHAAVADLVLRVQQTYFQLLAARALVEAEGSAVRQAQQGLDAAEARRRAGVATIAEVLQARTALSQVRLALQQIEGQQLALRGALATLAGLPPTAELEVGALPAQVRAAETLGAVEALLATAAARNPDVGRAGAQAAAAEARARGAGRAWLPVLSAQASAARSFYLDPSDAAPQTTWTFGLGLRFPLFDGLGLRSAYDALAARAGAEAARARADATGQRVALDVWTSFQGFRTAGGRVETARDLVASAQASADVAQGRYREGVGSILDLLTALAALESARAEDVRARTDYLVALAQLARATGQLDLPAAPPAPEGPAPSPGPEGRP